MGLRRTQCLKDYTLTKQGVKLGCGTGQEKGVGGRGNKRRAERGREQNQDGARGAEASLFYSLSWPQRHHATITSEWADPSHHNGKRGAKERGPSRLHSPIKIDTPHSTSTSLELLSPLV